MRTRLWILILGWLIAAPVAAQPLGNPQNITVVDSGTACVTAPSACASFAPNTSVAVAFSVSGTFSATLTAEATADGSTWRTVTVYNANGGTPSTAITSGGNYSINNVGFVGVRLRCTAYTSGTAVVAATRGFGVFSKNAPAFPASFTAGDLLYADTSTSVSGIADVAVGQVLVSGGVGAAPAYSANPTATTFTANRPSIATTSTDGFIAVNATAATSGVPVQQSPRIRLRSNVWNTTAVAANNTDDWWIESVPVSGLVPMGLLKVSSSLNGAGAVTFAYVDTAGNLSMNAAPPTTNTLASVFMNHGAFSAQTGGTGELNMGYNWYYNSGWKYRNTGVAGKIGFSTVSAGDWSVQTAPSGSADATITWVERLRISNSLGLVSAVTGWALGSSPVLMASATAPTIASGGCTSPAVTWSNGTAAFLLTLGSSCTNVKTMTLTMPTSAHFWMCDAVNNTGAQSATNVVVGTATSTTAVVLSNYSRTTGLAADYTAADTVLVKCSGG